MAMASNDKQAVRTGDELPKVKCRLVGEDGNAFSILGRFQKAARRAGWSKEETDAVIKEAMSGDYNHLLAFLCRHCDLDDI